MNLPALDAKSLPHTHSLSRPLPVRTAHALSRKQQTSRHPTRQRCRAQQHQQDEPHSGEAQPGVHRRLSSQAAVWLALLQAAPALAAEDVDFSKGSFAPESYWVTLGLFLIALPGLWSQIKRAPKAKVVRKTFEVPGPVEKDAMPLDRRAQQVFRYFKKYNYELKETGEVIRFVGTYQANRGQAAALVFYVFCGLASTALVLSVAAPFGGESWFWLTALSPLAGVYYWQRATRDENASVKMVTSDDERTTDIVIEADTEEVDRFRKELALAEKGKVYVKGLLET